MYRFVFCVCVRVCIMRGCRAKPTEREIHYMTRTSLKTSFNSSDVLHVYSSPSCRYTFRPGQAFMKEAKERGMNGLEGHPVSGRTGSSFQFFFYFNFYHFLSFSINASSHGSCPISGCWECWAPFVWQISGSKFRPLGIRWHPHLPLQRLAWYSCWWGTRHERQ